MATSGPVAGSPGAHGGQRGFAIVAVGSRHEGPPMKEEMDRRWHDLGEFIREQRRVGQLSLRKLSEMAGISNPYLSQIERGLRKPSAEILQQIARALEISSETLYVRAGILEEPGRRRRPGRARSAATRRSPRSRRRRSSGSTSRSAREQRAPRHRASPVDSPVRTARSGEPDLPPEAG